MKRKLKKISKIYRRSQGRIREFAYVPNTDRLLDRIYEYARKLYDRYGIVLNVRLVKVNGRYFVALRQDRTFSNVDKNVPIVTIYVSLEDGYVYVPKSYFEKLDPFFVYSACQHVVFSLGYEVRSKTVGYIDQSNRKIYISKSSK